MRGPAVQVSREVLARAARIVHAIATGAERRGWTIAIIEPSAGEDRRTSAEERKSHMQITAGDHVFWLRLREEGVQTRGPWEQTVHHYRNVPDDSSYWCDRKLPRGPYDAEAWQAQARALHP